MSSHPLTVTPASFNASAPVILIAAGASSPLARRDGGRRLLPSVLRLIQFRSAALAGAGLIAGVQSLAGLVVRAVGARVQRVFFVNQGVAEAALHVPNVTSETERDAPQFRARGA